MGARWFWSFTSNFWRVIQISSASAFCLFFTVIITSEIKYKSETIWAPDSRRRKCGAIWSAFCRLRYVFPVSVQVETSFGQRSRSKIAATCSSPTMACLRARMLLMCCLDKNRNGPICSRTIRQGRILFVCVSVFSRLASFSLPRYWLFTWAIDQSSDQLF